MPTINIRISTAPQTAGETFGQTNETSACQTRTSIWVYIYRRYILAKWHAILPAFCGLAIIYIRICWVFFADFRRHGENAFHFPIFPSACREFVKKHNARGDLPRSFELHHFADSWFSSAPISLPHLVGLITLPALQVAAGAQSCRGKASGQLPINLHPINNCNFN